MTLTDLRSQLEVKFDQQTDQWFAVNDNTPGVYGVGETKQWALNLYLEVLKESVTADFIHQYKLDEAVI